MLKRFFAIMLCGAIWSGIGFQTVRAQSNYDDRQLELKSQVSKLGIGKNARVEVKMRDNTKLKGYVIETGDDSFTIADSKTAVARTIPYADVAQVKKSGGGISLKTLGIIGAVAAGAIVTWVVVKPALCDGGAQTRGPC